MTDRTDEASEDEDRARVRYEALSVLRDALQWSLTPGQWAGVDRILSDLGGQPDAVDLGRPERRRAVEDATVRLELAGPRRIENADTPAAPAPEDIRERLNILVDKLSGGDGKNSGAGGKR